MENFIDYVESYFQLTLSDEQKGITILHEDFKKQTYNRQTTYHQDSFCMYISDHRNGIASTIEFKFEEARKTKTTLKKIREQITKIINFFSIKIKIDR